MAHEQQDLDFGVGETSRDAQLDLSIDGPGYTQYEMRQQEKAERAGSRFRQAHQAESWDRETTLHRTVSSHNLSIGRLAVDY